MKLINPIDIDLLTFIRSGKFDYIKPGQTKEWIINNFPDPDNIEINNYNNPIWFYGNIEFHFDRNEKLFLIYSDYIDTLDGGKSLRLHKWIFEKPGELTIQNVTRNLAKERIGYQLKYVTLTSGFTSAEIGIIGNDVSMGFSLPESNDEDYSEYLEKLTKADSNLFKLTSISLMKR